VAKKKFEATEPDVVEAPAEVSDFPKQEIAKMAADLRLPYLSKQAFETIAPHLKALGCGIEIVAIRSGAYKGAKIAFGAKVKVTGFTVLIHD